MSSPKKSTIVDPDYEMTEVARERVRLKENRENREKAERTREVINREFKMELDHRQSQLELIQQRLNQAQKTLHLLRYVLITSYYSDKDLLVNQIDETSGSNEESSLLNKNRIHPAIKKLLGNNPNDYKFTYTKSPRKKMKFDVEKQEKPPTSEASELSSHTMEWDETSDQLSTTSNEIKPLDDVKEFDTSRNRKKAKYRVVVGNISKWMPSKSEEDKSTHKWMVYVRGSKESPDISHFVQKVVFYLHPSYQPNDVVELREGPFHLSRRGWGEFPLRVRIFFQCSLNKPVDIIHNLKLDKTFTGRQTLGNETIVNLFLYKDDKKPAQKTKRNSLELPIQIKKEVEEEVDLIEQKHVMPNLEHDYCCVGIKQEVMDEDVKPVLCLPSTSYDYLTEHSYCVNNTSQPVSNQSLVNSLEEQGTDLIYGLGDVEQAEIIEEVVLDDVKIPVRKIQNLQRFIISNGTVIAIKKRRKPQESLLKKMFNRKYNISSLELVPILHQDGNHSIKLSNDRVIELSPPIDYEKYKVDFPSHKFKNVHEALPYLFKRLPLISELASDLNYKCTYPYAAKSLDEYSSWNIGRRLSSEWFQAKTILNIITEAQLPDYKNWTIKSVIMYGRSHGYTPLCNYKIFKNKTNLPEDILNGTTNTIESTTDLIKPKMPELNVPDVVVDVINCTPDPELTNSSLHKERLVDHKLDLACSYVKQAALDVGLVFKPEEIIPGVLFNTVERILLQAALSLAEDLVRRARADIVRRGNFREETSIIGLEDIQRVLRERPEFKVLLKSYTDDQ